MKKIALIALAAAALTGLATASEYEVKRQSSGENSYSGQNPVARTVSHRARRIPAPSAWTPPERLPQTAVRMVHRDQPRKLSGGFTIPTFSNATFTNPTFQVPQWTVPQNNNRPSFQVPAFTAPALTSPTYTNPSYSTPGYTNPGYTNPSYNN